MNRMSVATQREVDRQRLEGARMRYIADHKAKHASPRYLGTETRWQRFVRWLRDGQL